MTQRMNSCEKRILDRESWTSEPEDVKRNLGEPKGTEKNLWDLIVDEEGPLGAEATETLSLSLSLHFPLTFFFSFLPAFFKPRNLLVKLKNRDHVSCLSFHLFAVFEQVQTPVENFEGFSRIRPYEGNMEEIRSIMKEIWRNMKATMSAGQVLTEERMHPGTGATSLHYTLWLSPLGWDPTRKVILPKRR